MTVTVDSSFNNGILSYNLTGASCEIKRVIFDLPPCMSIQYNHCVSRMNNTVTDTCFPSPSFTNPYDLTLDTNCTSFAISLNTSSVLGNGTLWFVVNDTTITCDTCTVLVPIDCLIELTTGSISTGSITSGPVTSGALTSGGLTTSPLTTGSISTGSITSGLSTAPVTSSQITSSPLTTAHLTTSPLTTSRLTTGKITSGEVTSAEATTSILQVTLLTTGHKFTDCNENGLDDQYDIQYKLSKDKNNNGIPDECEGLDVQYYASMVIGVTLGFLFVVVVLIYGAYILTAFLSLLIKKKDSTEEEGIELVEKSKIP